MSLPPLTPELAAGLARIALGHVTREYPNKLDHVLTAPADLLGPKALHPVFHGSLDWHSCVHGYWLLARIRRRFPELPEVPAIGRLFAEQLTAEKIAGERAYLDGPMRDGFERPYGWAWLLMLAAELSRHGAGEAAVLRPLTEAFVAAFVAFLPKATYPIRAGTHANTAFALALALEYADVTQHAELAAAARTKALAWYGEDADCQAWEPSGEDFLSSALIEAECMRRALAPNCTRRALARDAFAPWLDRFLPRLAHGEPATLFRPAIVSDRGDGRIVHLDGLNLSRAWCWRSLAATFPPGDPRGARAVTAAEAHLDASLPNVTGDYMGEHWLASFALLALDAEPAA
jgi:hypothetical protein